MKKLILASAILAAVPAMAAETFFQAPDSVKTDSIEDFKFTDIKVLKTTPVKDQNKSGTCWCFSGTSLIEEDVLRQGGPELDLSEMFTVRKTYLDKAKKYVQTMGTTGFSQGGAFPDVTYVINKYGAVPEEAYPGLNYGEKGHSHYEMEAAMKGYLDAIVKNPNRKLSTAWLRGLEGILDAYLGPEPETFTYNGKTYTPQSFADEMGLRKSEWIGVTSFNHHPFYESFILEVPDNWLWEKSLNVPIEDLEKIIDNSIENGYTVGWASDVSEPGFKWAKGYCINPEVKSADNLEGTELARWVKLSAQEKQKENEVKSPKDLKEKKVTQEMRQEGWENFTTTDDHGMVLVGIAKDQAGNKYYKVKNSWNKANIYDGYFYVSVPYVLEKTTSLMINKAALPKDIAKKSKF